MQNVPVIIFVGFRDKNERVSYTPKYWEFGGRTLNDLHLKFTANGNNNLSDQFKIDVLPTTIQWGEEKIASFNRDRHGYP